MLEKEPVSQLSTCSEEEGASSASLYSLLYTYIFCAEIKHKVAQLQTINMEGRGPRQEKSCLLTPHLWPQEMPFKNLHRRHRGLTPKMKGILSLSNT